MMEGPKNLEGSGYKGFGFKFSPAEFQAEVAKLVATGLSKDQAKEEVIKKETEARDRQKIESQDKTKRWAA